MAAARAPRLPSRPARMTGRKKNSSAPCVQVIAECRRTGSSPSAAARRLPISDAAPGCRPCRPSSRPRPRRQSSGTGHHAAGLTDRYRDVARGRNPPRHAAHTGRDHPAVDHAHPEPIRAAAARRGGCGEIPGTVEHRSRRSAVIERCEAGMVASVARPLVLGCKRAVCRTDERCHDDHGRKARPQHDFLPGGRTCIAEPLEGINARLRFSILGAPN
jgi:hypothetical protein